MHKKILIIGAGAMTRAITSYFRRFNPDISLSILDRDAAALSGIAEFTGIKNITCHQGDASDMTLCRDLLKGRDLAIGAAGYHLNYELTHLAIKQKVNWVDLGGNNDVVGRQFQLSGQAVDAGVSVIPDCGLAPGMVSILAGDAISKLDRTEELHFRVGGLPREPKPPLFYGLVFSPDGLINEYSEPARVIEDGVIQTVPSLTGWERVHIGPPYGVLEAFHTSGGSSTMVLTFEGKVDTLDYKTLRYPGHLRQIKLLSDLGFFDRDEIVLDDESHIIPRRLFAALLERFGWVKEDVVILKSWAIGCRDNRKVRIDYSMIEYHDPETGFTAMARCTGFSAAVIAQMILNGAIVEKGVLRQETACPPSAYFEELKKTGIEVIIEEKNLDVSVA